MKNERFQCLLDSVREGGRILRGEQAPARRTVIPVPDVKAIRKNLHFSQPQFAALMGVGTGTLRHWERGDRKPTGSARLLLFIAQKHPDAVIEASANLASI